MTMSDAQRQELVRLIAQELMLAKAEQAVWNEEAGRLQDRLIELMKAPRLIGNSVHAKTSSYVVTLPDGDKLKVTCVRASHVVTDATALKKKLRADQWKLVVSESLDKAKLEAAMTTGQIDPAIVAAVSEDIPNAPYVKLTRAARGTGRKRK